MGGTLALRRANVKWFLSVDPDDLPFPAAAGTPPHPRSLTVDGTEVEMSDGFGDLHTRVYEEILAGKGHGIEVPARRSNSRTGSGPPRSRPRRRTPTRCWTGGKAAVSELAAAG